MVATAAARVSDFADTGRGPVLAPPVGLRAVGSEGKQAAEVFAGFGNRVDVRPRVSIRRVSTIVIVASACWLAVFAVGYAVLG